MVPREMPLQMEIAFRNVNISYKRVTSTLFLELLLHLRYLKIVLKPKRHILLFLSTVTI